MSHHRSSVVASAGVVDKVIADRRVRSEAADSRPVWCDEPAPVPTAVGIAVSVLSLLVVALLVW